ncbi:hypothetical protein [Kangiella shandongensis]|uniref:hypothetical protein n=1 Tax=Kangiella shandongensis TaxID=2763258 RepID=UPI001CBF749A|nr:hypothetical protein [Kangiella shandongensis]
MSTTRLSYTVLAIVITCLLQSCTKANSDVQPTSAQDLYAEIQREAQVQGCMTHDDCALLPVGKKPCGGPESYQPYSKTSSDVAKLKELGERYRDMREQYNLENQIMGTCVVTPKPRVSCVRNQCMASEQSTHIQ